MSSPTRAAEQVNYDVDYVIKYNIGEDASKSSGQLEQLLRTLSQIGLQTEVRPGDKSYILIFVKATQQSLQRATHTSRVRDWLYGLRNTQPGGSNSPEADTDAERLRVIHFMITAPNEYGGADIIPKHGQWKNVDSIFALHDERTNQEWMRDWSKKTFLSRDDLDQIRNKFGEKVGFYFAFLQTYFRFLLFPAVFGFSCWVLLGPFSPAYAIVNSLWCVIFVEYWRRQEVDFSLRWQVKGVSVLETRRREFQPEKEVRDEATGQMRPNFPWTKRLLRQLLQVPFALVAALSLGAIIATCFAIEIFISEIYKGPFKSYLVFIPTILLSSLIPTISGVLTKVATKLNDYENYETQEAYDAAFIQKILVLNFITSYLPILLTAFVYVPFASVIVPHLDIFGVTVHPFVSKEDRKTIHPTEFKINPSRLRKQVIYFTVTAQIVNFALETVVPFLKLKVFRKYKEISADHQHKRGDSGSGNKSVEATATVGYTDPPEESHFLNRVRQEAELPDYDVSTDLREMVIQFGYLSLFSPVWPLVPVSFLINNWVELRSDFFKICKEFRRPIPERADTIGPWLNTLSLLAWWGSITSSALIYLFYHDINPDAAHPSGDSSSDHRKIKGWILFLTIFIAEHVFLGIRSFVELTLQKVETPSMRHQRAKEYLLRKTVIGDEPPLSPLALDQPAQDEKVSLQEIQSKITKQTLEDDAREATLREAHPSDRFWARQRNWREAAAIGKRIIDDRVRAKEEEKHKKTQ